MQVIVRARNVPFSSALRVHCTGKLERALTRVGERVRTAELVLEDVNGPRGGGHVCRLWVGLDDGTELVFHSREGDAYAATGHAASLARHAVRRALSRGRTHQRAS